MFDADERCQFCDGQGSNPAADKEIDILESRLDAADRETLAAFDIERTKLDAADALADAGDKVENVLEVLLVREIWEARPAALAVATEALRELGAALREYREVSK